MKIGEAFPSNFLKADDLGGKDVTVTIESCEMESIGQGHDKQDKLVLSFVGKGKKMVTNKTNAKTIAKLHGDDTDDWPGKRIILSPREVEFQGDMVMAIRVSLKAPVVGKPIAPAAPSRSEEEMPSEDADRF
jgi:hypothetical protein